MTCLVQATSKGNITQVDFMVKNDLIKLILEILTLQNETTLIVDALEVLLNVLSTGKEAAETLGGHNPFLIRIEKEGGIKIIENLQHYMEESVARKASEIIEEFIDTNKHG